MTNTPGRRLHLADLTRGEIGARAPSCVLVVPWGATEQHGDHLPVGVDTLLADEMALRAATLASERVDVIVAPVLAVGCSEHHLHWPGALSLRPPTFLSVAEDILRSTALSGFRRVFVINAHGGNTDLLRAAARSVCVQHEIDVAIRDWWADLVIREAIDIRVPGHAGAFETAAIASVRPGLAVESPAPRHGTSHALPASTPGYLVERAGAWSVLDGVSDDPSRGKSIDGGALVSDAAQALAVSIIAFAETPRFVDSREPIS